MATKFRTAPEVQEIAEELIAEHHPHLIGHRIEYVFRDKATTKNGKTELGTARVVKGRTAFLARPGGLEIHGDTGEIVTLTADSDKPTEPIPFFEIEIALDTWGGTDRFGERWGLTDAQRIALIDHELCHCEVDDDGNLYARPHSIEEFTEIIERHGLWKGDVKEFARAAKTAKELPLGGSGW